MSTLTRLQKSQGRNPQIKKDVGYLEKQAKKSLEEFALKEEQEEEDFDSFLGEYLSAIE